MRLPLVISFLAVNLSISCGYPHTGNENSRILTIQTEDQSFEDSVVDKQSEQAPEATQTHELHEDEAFYPSFSPFQNPPLGHSRPFLFQQEGAYSQRPVSPFQQQLSYDTYKGGGFTQNEDTNSFGLLGSGNFGVISGGTFYNDNDGDSSGYENKYNPFYQNGHGRPTLIFGRLAKSRPQQQEQFANFRDFADINTPSYSQYVVVYTNKNNTQNGNNVQRSDKRPNNIIEQLALLDEENLTTSKPEKKLSKSKRKLAMLLPEKKIIGKQLKKSATAPTIDLLEPLLALS